MSRLASSSSSSDSTSRVLSSIEAASTLRELLKDMVGNSEGECEPVHILHFPIPPATDANRASVSDRLRTLFDGPTRRLLNIPNNDNYYHDENDIYNNDHNEDDESGAEMTAGYYESFNPYSQAEIAGTPPFRQFHFDRSVTEDDMEEQNTRARSQARMLEATMLLLRHSVDGRVYSFVRHTRDSEYTVGGVVLAAADEYVLGFQAAGLVWT